MTTTMTDPIGVLDKNLKTLEGMKKRHEGFIPRIQEDWERAQLAYNAAREYYDQHLAEIEDIETGIVRHREAIAQLKNPMVSAQTNVPKFLGLHIFGCPGDHHGPCEDRIPGRDA